MPYGGIVKALKYKTFHLTDARTSDVLNSNIAVNFFSPFLGNPGLNPDHLRPYFLAGYKPCLSVLAVSEIRSILDSYLFIRKDKITLYSGNVQCHISKVDRTKEEKAYSIKHYTAVYSVLQCNIKCTLYK